MRRSAPLLSYVSRRVIPASGNLLGPGVSKGPIGRSIQFPLSYRVDAHSSHTYHSAASPPRGAAFG